ncbi:MAG: site-specific recombinase [Bacteroidota bacterium]|nr:site-specific recombinase [Bacteroidota bacterium]
MDFKAVISDQKAGSLQVLTTLVAGIRPGRLESTEFAVKRIRELINLINTNADLRAVLLIHFAYLNSVTSSTTLFTQSGLISTGGFFSDVVQKIKHSMLPPLKNPQGLETALNTIFNKPWDHKWVNEIPNEIWLEIVNKIDFKIRLLPDGPELNEVLNSILILSHRIVVLGLDPLLVAKVPGISTLDSPFFHQNQEITLYVEALRSMKVLPGNGTEAYLAILKTLAHCVEKLHYVRLNKDLIGASMGLTYQIIKLDQHVHRLKLLLKILHETHNQQEYAVIRLFKELVFHENTRDSIFRQFSSNIGLLAFQVTEHAAKTGEHYISNDRKEYWEFFKYAMGGGFIVALMVVIKVAGSHIHLPPFILALFNGLNYGIGFLVIHFAGFILATKQPAMTATLLAGSLEGHANDNIGISNLAKMIVKISRTQFISFAGNLVMVFPVAWLLSYVFTLTTGIHLAGEEKATIMITELHPVNSYSVWYAAIAGMLLFSAGLISGYFDNKSVFNRIPERIFAHPLLQKMAEPRRKKIAHYIGENLGSLSGNFILGLLLAFMPFIGFITGLPVDVRHVTFITGSFGFATQSLGNKVETDMIFWTLSAIILIGLTNFIVSFGLAIYTAIQARNVRFRQTWKLVNLLTAWFFTYPLDFFFPPVKERSVELVETEVTNQTDEYP